MKLSLSEDRLNREMSQLLSVQKERLRSQIERLEALSPLAVLRRGYAAVSRGDELLRSARSVLEGDKLQIAFADGTVHAVVTNSKETEI